MMNNQQSISRRMKWQHYHRGMRVAVVASLLSASMPIAAKVKAPVAVGPVPTENQMRWQEMEEYAFIHYSLNTYTDMEWGYGNEDLQLFNPSRLDARQWAKACKDAGMKGIIFTAKHHSGFCMWPSAYTDYSVKNTPWKNGKGDVVRELAEACKAEGLRFAVYLSPWDRNHADYGKPEYITYFRNQLKELLTRYGEMFEVWFDGANGGNGYYGGADETRQIDRTTYYQWPETYRLIRQWQPNIVIWNDGGDRGDLRWVGTEAGYVGETNWSLLHETGDVPIEMLRYGVKEGDAWVPGEVNTSIRPGWFYHDYEDSRVKSVSKLMDTYYKSVGRNGTLLLNFPVNLDGQIHPNDVATGKNFAQTVKEVFANDLMKTAKVKASQTRGKSKLYAADKVKDGDKHTYWATDDNITHAALTMTWKNPIRANRFMVQEYIRLGQRVEDFMLEAWVDGAWKELKDMLVEEDKDGTTTIGYKRIICFPTIETSQLRFTVKQAKACPLISHIGVFEAPQVMEEPLIARNKEGVVSIQAMDSESEVYYTLDGSTPTTLSARYTQPFSTSGKRLMVKAIAVDGTRGKQSGVAVKELGMVKKLWRVVSADDEKAQRVIDGSERTGWYQPTMDTDLVVDLGETTLVSGFKYLPVQWGKEGIITHYRLSLSTDNTSWTVVSEGEFSNIVNNPLWQTLTFHPTQARYVKVTALRLAAGNQPGYEEIEVF
ncbi:MAG: alpha-L-fucosidase [Prevotellaceae bacterium]|nr:alpha-L-fucosidase [Prevotellaceae bacterium]MDY3364995.1 alpha-L-fucosidase [Prevotella sp.]